MANSHDSKIVKVISAEYITPETDTPSHSIWLSNLDIIAIRKCYTPIINIYKHNNGDAFFDVDKLKSSLSKALVPFYPFAGEYGYDDDGRIEIHCTRKGVFFVEASCDKTIEEFSNFTPGAALLRLFFPKDIASADPPCPLILLQLTRFKCGGVCLGTSVHHMTGDGTSSLSFISAWAAISRGDDPATIQPPFLDRSILKARSPPHVEFDHTEYEYCNYTDKSGKHTAPPPTRNPVTTKILQLSKAQVAKLKADGNGATTFTAVVGHVWRSVCRARDLPMDRSTRVFMPVDIRSRFDPPLPMNFLGNAIVPMKVEAAVAEVVEGTIEEIGRKFEEVKKRLHCRYFRSQIDFVEMQPRDGRVRLLAEDLLAVNWLNLPIHSAANFGWGAPVYIGRAVFSYSGTVYVTRNLTGEEGSVLVTVALEEDRMGAYEKIFYETL